MSEAQKNAPIKLLWKHLLIQKDAPPKRFGLIETPDDVRDLRPISGVILKVGPGLHNDFFPGDRVIFGEFAGHTFRLDDETYTMLTPAEVLGVIPVGAQANAEP